MIVKFDFTVIGPNLNLSLRISNLQLTYAWTCLTYQMKVKSPNDRWHFTGDLRIVGALCIGGILFFYNVMAPGEKFIYSQGGAIMEKNCSWLNEIELSQERIYSQSVQDGILHHIFSHLGTTNKMFVEFGFGYSGDGVTKGIYDNKGLNTANLRYMGWEGVYFDALLESKEFNVRKAILTSENVVSHFLGANIPYDVDYVSIDVDSIDLWLLKSILESRYRPRIVSVEFNGHFAADMLVSMENKWHPWTERSVYGASAAAINYIATLNGYSTIHIMKDHLDMFLARNDLLEGCKKPSFFELAVGKIPAIIHAPCIEEDIARLVEVGSILSYPDDHDYANKNARALIDRLASHFKINMCFNVSQT